MKSRDRLLHAPHRPLPGWRVFSLATLASMRGPAVILRAALADHNQIRLERELAGRDGGHTISTTHDIPASTHRSSEATR